MHFWPPNLSKKLKYLKSVNEIIENKFWKIRAILDIYGWADENGGFL